MTTSAFYVTSLCHFSLDQAKLFLGVDQYPEYKIVTVGLKMKKSKLLVLEDYRLSMKFKAVIRTATMRKYQSMTKRILLDPDRSISCV